MLDDINAFATELLELGKTHPALSALFTLVVWLAGVAWRYTGDVALSENAKERRRAKREAAARTQLRADVQRLLASHQSGRFTFGRISTDVHVVDFLLTGYPKGSIISRKVDYVAEVPEKYAEGYADSLAMYKAKLANSEIFEGTPKIAPKRILLDRSQGEEAKILKFEYAQSPGYVHQRAASEVYRRLEPSARAELTLEPLTTMEPFFSNSLGIILAVITGDSQLVFVERGGSTAVNRERIVCGVVEGLTIQDLHQGSIDPYQAANRALNEELGINLEPAEFGAIKITACIFNDEFHEWNLLGYVDLRPLGAKYTSQTLVEYKSTAMAHDSWEVRDLVFLEFEPEKVSGYLLAFDDRVVNYAKVAAVLALMCAFGRPSDVAAAFAIAVGPGADS
jgi:8-oxo-dGTP pyrophosphatase MutT (NUDIX family)